MKIRGVHLYCRYIFTKEYWWWAYRYISDPYYGGPSHLYDIGPFTLAIRIRESI
jgi:hypothetical protein